MQHFPWGGKLTSESIKFFSPIVIWTKFTSSPQKYDVLYSAFRDYYKIWLELIDTTVKETDEYQIFDNLEAQHRYLTWRAEKDLLRSFLFNGVNELGSKKFHDYFPHYNGEEGSLNKKGGIIGKSFENRPWDARGEFLAFISLMQNNVVHVYLSGILHMLVDEYCSFALKLLYKACSW
ncbi:phytochromobilin:ferredoxin oxidoreductase, chloroplastic-like [Cicer arietinum]|uniref:phytochromobilin:ferredoxin oxidoreductase, chloroplastic-like n=1 Tax=Cicer arietinum TaxID=3827 RepID=UPI003CC5F5E0